MDDFKPFIAKVATGATLSREEARDAFDTILSGEVTNAQSAAFLMALAQIHVRWLAKTEPTLAIVFWFHISCTLGSLISIPFGWVWPDPRLWLLLVTAGVFGGIAQILLTESYRNADASTLAPFDYSSMIYGLLIGYFIFAEVPATMVLIGAAIVISAGLFILYREHQLGILAAKSRAKPGMTPQG